LGIFDSYAIDNDLAYVDAKIRSYYEVGEDFLTEEEMAEIDEEAKRAEIEPPKPRSERRRSRNAEPEAKPERKQRKSREEVEQANHEAIADYVAECDKAVDEVADGRTEVPWEEVEEATANVPTPELENVPRRRRRRTE
jgi:hypothetical protein